jgi:hypothetical protein
MRPARIPIYGLTPFRTMRPARIPIYGLTPFSELLLSGQPARRRTDRAGAWMCWQTIPCCGSACPCGRSRCACSTEPEP